MALTVGTRLGHYDVTALIGEGGMGQVYHATDTTLSRQVALKTAGGVSGFFARFFTLTPELRLSVGNRVFMCTLPGGVR